MHAWLERPLLNGKDADEWKPSDASEVASNLQKWYQAGRLLFPREWLQRIHDQIQKAPQNGDLISVRGFDEVVYEYRVMTGNKRWSFVPKNEDEYENEGVQYSTEDCERVEYIVCKPHICYNSIEHLHSQLDWSMSRAYTSLCIGHWMTRVGETEPPGDLAASTALFQDSYAAWEASAAWTQIETTLRSLRLSCPITKVIGIACGSFAITASDTKGRARSAVQHAFLLTVKKTLQENGMAGDEVACYVQDPAYGPTDGEVLQKHDIQVVEDPEGFLQMDPSSVVFSCAPNICVKQIVADIVRPALLIWCRVEEEDPKHSSTDPDSPRVRAMVAKEYEELPFPENENFTAMRIYARRE